MFDFLQTIFHRAATFLVASIIGVASVFTPASKPATPLPPPAAIQQEVVQQTNENKDQAKPIENSSSPEESQSVASENEKVKQLERQLNEEKDKRRAAEELTKQIQILQEQQQSLQRAQEQQNILTPQITGIDPRALPFDDLFMMTIHGSNFQDNAEVLVNDHSLGRFKLQDSGALQKDVIIQGDSPNTPYWILNASTWKIEVVNPNGKSDIEEGIFLIDDFPHRFSDTKPPYIIPSRVTGLWEQSDWIKANCGMLYGTIGLRRGIYEDSPPSSGIAKVEWFVDINGNIASLGSVYIGDKIAWDTTTMPNGEYTLIAKVWDKAGNVGEASIKARVLNPGIFSLKEPKTDCPTY